MLRRGIFFFLLYFFGIVLLDIDFTFIPSPDSSGLRSPMQSSELAQWHSYAAFFALIAGHRLVGPRRRRAHADRSVDRPSTEAAAAARAPPPFPWEPRGAAAAAPPPSEEGVGRRKRTVPRNIEPSLLPGVCVKAGPSPEDARRQLHLLANLSYTGGLRPPSCPCCR